MPKLSIDKRLIVFGSTSSGTPHQSIVQHFNCHWNSVERLVQRFQKQNEVRGRPCTARSRSTTCAQDRYILLTYLWNHRPTAGMTTVNIPILGPIRSKSVNNWPRECDSRPGRPARHPILIQRHRRVELLMQTIPPTPFELVKAGFIHWWMLHLSIVTWWPWANIPTAKWTLCWCKLGGAKSVLRWICYCARKHCRQRPYLAVLMQKDIDMKSWFQLMFRACNTMALWSYWNQTTLVFMQVLLFSSFCNNRKLMFFHGMLIRQIFHLLNMYGIKNTCKKPTTPSFSCLVYISIDEAITFQNMDDIPQIFLGKRFTTLSVSRSDGLYL